MNSIKTLYVTIIGYRYNDKNPLFKYEVLKNDGFAWCDAVRKLYADNGCDYLVIEPVVFKQQEIF